MEIRFIVVCWNGEGDWNECIDFVCDAGQDVMVAMHNEFLKRKMPAPILYRLRLAKPGSQPHYSLQDEIVEDVKEIKELLKICCKSVRFNNITPKNTG